MIFKILEDFIEDCKEKEYVVYCSNRMTGGYNRYLFTKKELLKFVKEHELATIEVFKIKDEIKINKIIEIEEVTNEKD